jgi:hypothetical protein
MIQGPLRDFAPVFEVYAEALERAAERSARERRRSRAGRCEAAHLVQMSLPTATNRVPAAFVATASQYWFAADVPAVVLVQVTPESVEIQTSPVLPGPLDDAMSVAPVASDATEKALERAFCWFHLSPASVDVQTPEPTATMFMPLASDATELHPVS